MTREKLLRYGKEYLHDLETACCEIEELHLNFVRESIKALSQEPCDDDGVDHEKIRKAFAKESDIKKADIADMIPKVIMQVEEERDRFIFNTIRPYCEEITQQEISKEILSKALTQYFSKPTECDDAISRETVIDTLQYAWEANKDIQESIVEIEALPSVTQKSGKWIPVNERLPEDEQEILFSTKTGRVHSGKYHDDDSANQWYSHRDKCRAWNNVVSAWMPLPKPYEPKESEEQTE